jgi:hypothetical protein
MFISIKFLPIVKPGYLVYNILDSTLGVNEISINYKPVSGVDLEKSAYCTAAVVALYTTLNKIPHNVALYYRWWHTVERFNRLNESGRSTKFELYWLDNYYPELNYRKYYPCLISQIRLLNFRNLAQQPIS